MTAVPVQGSLLGVEQQEATNDDYYTPTWVFDALGLRFDLDVCAPPGGAPWVPADRYYTKADDGLACEWFGRVWMNPPFSKTGPWIDRWIAHGHGVALVPSSNGEWFDRLWSAGCAITIGPRHFEFLNGKGHGIPRRIHLAALGDDCVAALSRIGRVRVLAEPNTNPAKETP